MASDEHFDQQSSAERPSPLDSPDTRIDAAHVRHDDPSAVSKPVDADYVKAAAAEYTPEVSAQQVRNQAAQLAAHLQQQRSTVDHRESELNARVASMENQIRAARLWLDERHAELAARAAELDRRQRELEQRGGHVGEPTQSPQAAESLEPFRENLRRAESLLSQQRIELERQRRQLADSRDEFAKAMQHQRDRLADESRRQDNQHDHTRQQLDRQSNELAARHAALVRMQADVTRAREEALEMRLATEELWAGLSANLAPAALAQSLAQSRLKLAEEQQLAKAQLASERAEVEALASRVAEQHDKLKREREQLAAWIKRQREELARTAGLLSARERKLELDRAACDEKAAQWQSERFGLEQEIARLLRETGGGRSVAAA